MIHNHIVKACGIDGSGDRSQKSGSRLHKDTRYEDNSVSPKQIETNTPS
ncbi:MAG: hypothetical protein BWY82_02123 [Verrucomicrobia bacterium ADurb.Bin474]|nr:MAG: hypothetical protein BWY82_02123 [Verrucomicrobia bacterium ADurb.Bin474]